MKKTLLFRLTSSLVILATLAGWFSVPATVFAGPYQAPLMDVDYPYWECTENFGAACPDDAAPQLDIFNTFTSYNNLGLVTRSYIRCGPSDIDCDAQLANITEIYVRVVGSYAFTNAGEYSHSLQVRVLANGDPVFGQWESEVFGSCTGQDAGVCGVDTIVTIPLGVLGSVYNTWPPRIDVLLAMTNAGGGTTGTWTYTITYSFTELENCAETFTMLDGVVTNNDIYPFVEIPQGPDAVSPNLPDEMIAELNPIMIPGQTWLYKLTIDGGWNDGENDRSEKDYEISFDGETYTDLDEFEVLCKDTSGWIFETDQELFYIRANDEPEEFLDNTPASPPYPRYSIYNVEQIAPLTCSDQFSYDPEDDFVAAGIIYADNMYGSEVVMQTAEGELIPGEWYVIETLDGPWTNPDAEGETTDSYEIAVDTVDQNLIDEDEFGVWPFTQCWEHTDETETYKRYYFQAPETTLALFVFDPLFTYSTNEGRISYIMHRVEFTYWPAACERKFQVGDTLFQTEIQATSPNGMFLEPISADTFATDTLTDPYMRPGAGTSLDQSFDQNMWYVLETTLGPWKNEGAQNRWDMDIRDDSTEFYDFPDWPNAECVVKTDAVGHYRVYFQFPPGDADILKYVMRVSDGNDVTAYPANTGSMTVVAKRVTLAQVVEPGTEPVEGACDGSYTTGDLLATEGILPNRENGIFVPSLTLDGIYALTTDGYWKEGGDPGELTLPQISDDNGATWYDWNDYPHALCFETIIVETRAQWRLYIRVDSGRTYKVRADDQDDDFSNNVNYLFSLKVNEAQMLIDPFNTCADAYQMTNITLNPMADIIPGHLENGITVPTVSGLLYAIEIYKGTWKETSASPDRYDAAISMDSGETFSPFSDRSIESAQCYAEIGNYEWIYFTAGDAYTMLRVNGEAEEFDDNEGALYYRLYAARNVGDPNLPGDSEIGNYLPSSGVIGCYSSSVRPAPFNLPEYTGVELLEIEDFTGLADMVSDIISYWGDVARYTWNNALTYIGGTIAYYTSTAINFFLWCPEHTGAIKAIFADAMTLEPIYSIRRLVAFQKLTSAQIESYDWEMDNTAAMPFSEEGGGVEVDSLMPDMSDSPFVNGGTIEWTPIEGGGPSGVASCNAHLVLRWGTENPLVVGFCTVLELAKITNWNRVINIGIVVAAVALFFRYFVNRWVKEIITLVSGGGLYK